MIITELLRGINVMRKEYGVWQNGQKNLRSHRMGELLLVIYRFYYPCRLFTVSVLVRIVWLSLYVAFIILELKLLSLHEDQLT